MEDIDFLVDIVTIGNVLFAQLAAAQNVRQTPLGDQSVAHQLQHFRVLCLKGKMFLSGLQAGFNQLLHPGGIVGFKVQIASDKVIALQLGTGRILLRCQQQNIRLVALVELFVGTDPPQNVGGFGDLAEAVLQIALDCLERGEPVRFDIEQP